LYRMIIAAVEDGDMDPAYAKRTWSQYKNNQKKAIYSKEKAKKG